MKTSISALHQCAFTIFDQNLTLLFSPLVWDKCVGKTETI